VDRIVVLIKQVPDMEEVRFDRERGVIDRNSAGTEINPFDLNALEAAVQISEKTGAEVFVISMGPPSAKEAIREAIARGASNGVLLSDRKFGGADVKATAMTLAAGIRSTGPYSLVLAGMQTVDGDTGQVGPEIAEILGIPHAGYAESIDEVDESSVTLTTRIWDGRYQKKLRFPVLVTVTKDIASPRLPSLKSKMKARKAEIPVVGLEGLEGFLNEEETGLKGSATRVRKIVIPESQERAGAVYRDDIPAALNALIEVLKDTKVLEVTQGEGI